MRDNGYKFVSCRYTRYCFNNFVMYELFLTNYNILRTRAGYLTMFIRKNRTNNHHIVDDNGFAVAESALYKMTSINNPGNIFADNR